MSDNLSKNPIRYKTILVGDSGVGKQPLLEDILINLVTKKKV